jgi:hypothetical protein
VKPSKIIKCLKDWLYQRRIVNYNCLEEGDVIVIRIGKGESLDIGFQSDFGIVCRVDKPK